MKMYITNENDKITLHNTTNYPYENIILTHDELEQLAAYYQLEQDKSDMAEYLQSTIDIPDSAEISAVLAQKYLNDACLFDQLVAETNRLQDDLGYDFLTVVGKASEKLEKDRDIKEWHGITRSTAERFAKEFIADRNPSHWTGFGEVPDEVSLEPLNFPIDDIYPNGNKPVLRMQLIGVTYPSLHRVCECSIIEDGVERWARRMLDSMTAGTVEDLVETILYTARMYEKSKGFERIFVAHFSLEKSTYDFLNQVLAIPSIIGKGYRIIDVVRFADDTIASVLWSGNSENGVWGYATLMLNGKTVFETKSVKEFCNHWVLLNNGAEYHVFADVRPAPRILEKTIYISEKYAETIEKYLRGEELQGMGASLSETATFPDGFDMDIRCCGAEDDSFTEAILYDSKGRAVKLTDPCDAFTGCWELEDDNTGITYRVHVMTKPRLN